MALPYANSKTNPVLSQGRIEKILMKFGVSQTNFGRDLVRCDIRVSFIFNEIPVTIPINYLDLAKSFWSEKTGWEKNSWPREVDYENKHHEFIKTAINASFAAIEDYLKAMLTMHQMGIMSPEEIFLSNIDVQGIRMIDHLKARAPQLMRGEQLLLEN